VTRARLLRAALGFLSLEPRAIPEPATLALLTAGLLGTVLAAGARFRLS
jgi:PEP-CTERM motif